MCFTAVDLCICKLPLNLSWRHIFGAGLHGGIGFTMSLFIGQLAFRVPAYIEQAKLGILLASVVSAIIGLVWLYVVTGKKS